MSRLRGATATDLFCGGGGSSFGLSQIPGLDVAIAANHWRRAVDSHQKNHPGTDHDCADISQVDPRRYRRTTILWGSPDCTQHTKTSGRKRDQSAHTSDGKSLPMDPAERSRATMWDIVRFTEHHRYEAVIVENVVDAYAWLPYKAWLSAMHSFGYVHQMVWLNSAHATVLGQSAATSRNRKYVVFSKVGAPLPDIARWTSPSGACECGIRSVLVKSWKKVGGNDIGGEYRRQYVWRCGSCSAVVEPEVASASSVIDWSNPGTPLMTRRPALVAKTISKIQAGLFKHAVGGIAQPFIVEMRGGGSSTRSVSEPLATITAQGNHHALLIPPANTRPEDVRLVDCTYRLVTTDERKAATGFPKEYVLLGNDEDQLRMVGNAVTPPAARVLGSAVMEALTGQNLMLAA